MVAIKDKEVTEADVARVIETAKAVNIPTDQQIVHVLPQEFIIDGQEDIREPIGMSGVRLEVKVHIVTGAVSGSAEHHQVRAPLRARGQGPDPAAARLEHVDADGRTRRNSASRWSTSAAARPTSRSSPAARSATPR
jgi:hypothetical protein